MLGTVNEQALGTLSTRIFFPLMTGPKSPHDEHVVLEKLLAAGYPKGRFTQ